MRILIKWHRDKLILPLTAFHKDLYKSIHLNFWWKLGCLPSIIKCRDFNEKIQWLKLFDQQKAIIQCHDKILVRDFISDRAGGKYLVDLYQTHNHFSEINFDSLPSSFVIKTNHDSGTVILVRNKKKLDISKSKTIIEKSLKNTYGEDTGEWGYSHIKPKILVEQFIDPHKKKPPADYKFHCVNGKVKSCQYIYDRGFDTKELIISPNEEIFPYTIYFPPGSSADFQRPSNWNEMIDVAEKISKGFKYVRVDLYNTNETIFAGEMTFWPMGGCYKGEGQRQLGKLMNFSRNSFRAPLRT